MFVLFFPYLPLSPFFFLALESSFLTVLRCRADPRHRPNPKLSVPVLLRFLRRPRLWLHQDQAHPPDRCHRTGGRASLRCGRHRRYRYVPTPAPSLSLSVRRHLTFPPSHPPSSSQAPPKLPDPEAPKPRSSRTTSSSSSLALRTRRSRSACHLFPSSVSGVC